MESMTSLANEAAILARLIYRNNNQHGKTPLFSSYLKPLSKMLTKLTASHMEEVNKNSEDSLRSLGGPKLSSHLLTHAILSCNALRKYIQLFDNIINRLLLACAELRIMLDRKVFMPLFTVLYSLLARVCRIAASLLINFHTRMMALLSQIQRAVALTPRYEELVSSFLIRGPVSDSALRIIELSGNVYIGSNNIIKSMSSTKKGESDGAASVSDDGDKDFASGRDGIGVAALAVEEDMGETLVDSLLTTSYTEVDDYRSVSVKTNSTIPAEKSVKRSYNQAINHHPDSSGTVHDDDDDDEQQNSSNEDAQNRSTDLARSKHQDESGNLSESEIDKKERSDCESKADVVYKVAPKEPNQPKMMDHNTQLFNDSSLFFSTSAATRKAEKAEGDKSSDIDALKRTKKRKEINEKVSCSGTHQITSDAYKVGASNSISQKEKTIDSTATTAITRKGTTIQAKKKRRLRKDDFAHVAGGEDIDDIFAGLF